ncbi:integrase [Gossypium australe]|uniref:Integrase n=1 Tax=Gossypium australe TaxID=47621 RepID=A0A5B6V9S9_9ROSI|nr:integrase [Gossypium australe]
MILTKTLMLIQPELGKEFLVYSDASHTRLGCVLMHLKFYEHNYPDHKFELAAVVFALNIWRHYLYVEKCTICIDHKRIWVELLKDYDFVIDYHPGKANMVADALSRKSICELRALLAQLSVTSDGGLFMELQQIRKKQASDEELAKRVCQVEQGVREDFALNEERVLYFRGRFFVPNEEELQRVILNEAQIVLMQYT